MDKNKIDRINTLARLSKQRELSLDEKQEQAALRQEYLEEFRKTLRGVNEMDKKGDNE